jgi:hypothetical protein
LLRELLAVVLPYLELGHAGQMQVENSRPRFAIQTANPLISFSLFQLPTFNGQISTNICLLNLENLLKVNKKHIE